MYINDNKFCDRSWMIAQPVFVFQAELINTGPLHGQG